MEVLMAVLSVLAILALIVVAGFIIYALADLVIAIIEKKEGNVFGKDKKKSKDSYKYNSSLELDDEEKFLLNEDEVNMIDYKPEEKTDDKVEEKPETEEEPINGVNDAEAERERLLVKKSATSNVDWFKNGGETDYQSIIREERRKMLEEKQNQLNKKVLEEEDVLDDVEDEEEIVSEDSKLKNLNRVAYDKVIEEKAAEKQFEEDEYEDVFFEEDEEDEEDDGDKLISDIVSESIEADKINEQEVAKIDEKMLNEYEVKVQELEKKLQEQVEENEKIKKLADEIEAKYQEEKAMIESQKEDDKQKTPFEYDEDLLAQYEAKLEVLMERQKLNDKEYKQNKKEFRPLNRIKTTLAKDQDKLRRKEAIVAKQKIMLFGVNNSDGLDEEKAKKLDEEIDLLEGLRLSVQHCETVMEENKDRFPILEKANKILLTNKENIANDIAEVEKMIADMKKLKK